MDSEIKFKIKELSKKKWMKVSLIFEVLGTTREIVEKSLKEHIEKLEKIKTIFLYKKDFSKIEEVEKPMKNVEKAYSQIVETEAMIKDIRTLIIIAISYGPSSIEILEPKKIEISVGEIQDVSNMIAGIIHKFAAAGVGGIIATPQK
ncbi:MAG: hypothetical protein DRP14_00495 [Candidatus Aenigmatarchaeota archaeon]|nr:MAG: hypothetical protein DRP14_00495 [Candidatus Aenigmarchaeota archaeon]